MNEQLATGTQPGGGPVTPAPKQPRQLTAETEQASPEEQAEYDRFVTKAIDLVYDKQMLPRVVDMLEGEGDPIEGLARTSAMVVSRVMNAAEEAGVKLSGDVLFHGAKEVFEDLAELSRLARIKDFAEDQDAFEGAYFRALDALRMVLEGSGSLNREAAQADLAQLQQMDEAGELEGFFRSLAAGDDAAGAPTATEDEPTAEAPPQRANGLMPKGDA